MGALQGGGFGVAGDAAVQWQALMAIPGETLARWPTFFTFGIVDAGTQYLLQALPSMGGGPLGTIYRSGVVGMTDTIKFVTWEQASGGMSRGNV